MKTIAELKSLALNPWDMTVEDSAQLAALLDRLAAIDAAVPDEVREIARRDRWCQDCGQRGNYSSVEIKSRQSPPEGYSYTEQAKLDAITDRATLLTIAQRQAYMLDSSMIRCMACDAYIKAADREAHDKSCTQLARMDEFEQELAAARAKLMATENRLKVAHASIQMRDREIEELRTRLAECEPAVELVREYQEGNRLSMDADLHLMNAVLPATRTP